jgi:D-xylose 1-dehydrogenase (NADP+, D-xylono-1,5-lactone-forming)
VLCEKPLARTAAEAAEAFDVAERAGRLLMEAFMYRHSSQTRWLVELVAEGAIGRLRLIRAAFSFFLADPENVRLRPDVEGGALMDVGCYCVSGARLLAGEPERVYAEQVLGPTGVDISLAATLRFADGVLGELDCGLVFPERDELEAVGENGSLFLDDPWHARRPVIELRRDGAVERIEVERVDAYRLELENLSDAIRGRGEPLLGRDDAVGNAAVIEALYLSAATGTATRPFSS